jgi:hypothetical protein
VYVSPELSDALGSMISAVLGGVPCGASSSRQLDMESVASLRVVDVADPMSVPLSYAVHVNDVFGAKGEAADNVGSVT